MVQFTIPLPHLLPLPAPHVRLRTCFENRASLTRGKEFFPPEAPQGGFAGDRTIPSTVPRTFFEKSAVIIRQDFENLTVSFLESRPYLPASAECRTTHAARKTAPTRRRLP